MGVSPLALTKARPDARASRSVDGRESFTEAPDESGSALSGGRARSMEELVPQPPA